MPNLNHKGVEELDKRIKDSGLESLFNEMAEIADQVQTKTGWKRTFAELLLPLFEEQKEVAVVAELEKILAARSLATDLKEYTDIIKSRLDQLKSKQEEK